MFVGWFVECMERLSCWPALHKQTARMFVLLCPCVCACTWSSEYWCSSDIWCMNSKNTCQPDALFCCFNTLDHYNGNGNTSLIFVRSLVECMAATAGCGVVLHKQHFVRLHSLLSVWEPEVVISLTLMRYCFIVQMRYHVNDNFPIFVGSIVRLFVRSFVRSFVRLFVGSFVCSFVLLFIRACVCWLNVWLQRLDVVWLYTNSAMYDCIHCCPFECPKL